MLDWFSSIQVFGGDLHVGIPGGSIVNVSDPMAARPVRRTINELYPLHIGRTGGIVHRIALVLVGLTPAGFFVTGLLLWWNRSLGRLWRSRIASFRPPEMAERSR